MPSFSPQRHFQVAQHVAQARLAGHAMQCFSGKEIFAAMVAARLNPSDETLPHPRNPRGTKVSYTVLSWSLVLPDSWVTKDLLGSSTSSNPNRPCRD